MVTQSDEKVNLATKNIKEAKNHIRDLLDYEDEERTFTDEFVEKIEESYKKLREILKLIRN